MRVGGVGMDPWRMVTHFCVAPSDFCDGTDADVMHHAVTPKAWKKILTCGIVALASRPRVDLARIDERKYQMNQKAAEILVF